MSGTETITVVMRSNVTTETRDAALGLYKQLINETVKEKGCLKYELFCQANDPDKLALIEEWESEACLKAHTRTEHFQRIVPELAKLETEKPILIYKKLF